MPQNPATAAWRPPHEARENLALSSEEQIANLPIPLLEDREIQKINSNILKAMSYRDEALQLDLDARQMISQAILEEVR